MPEPQSRFAIPDDPEALQPPTDYDELEDEMLAQLEDEQSTQRDPRRGKRAAPALSGDRPRAGPDRGPAPLWPI